MIKFTMTVPLPEGWREVEAELLPDLAPHLAEVATFAAHRCTDNLWWVVANVETGMRVSYDLKRHHAVSVAKATLLNKTLEDTLSAYRKARRKYQLLKAA